MMGADVFQEPRARDLCDVLYERLLAAGKSGAFAHDIPRKGLAVRSSKVVSAYLRKMVAQGRVEIAGHVNGILIYRAVAFSAGRGTPQGSVEQEKSKAAILSEQERKVHSVLLSIGRGAEPLRMASLAVITAGTGMGKNNAQRILRTLVFKKYAAAQDSFHETVWVPLKDAEGGAL